MEINYSEFISTLAERTITNYEFVKDHAEGDKLYEVTQLINSLYCMLVVPQGIFGHSKSGNEKNTDFAAEEKYLKSKHEFYSDVINLIELLDKQRRLKYAPKESFYKNSPVSAFILNVRNSLCHDGIGFMPIAEEGNGKGKNRIDDIIFLSKYKEGGTRFITVLTVRQLEKLLYALGKMYAEVEKGKMQSNERKYRELFKGISDELYKQLSGYTDGATADKETFKE